MSDYVVSEKARIDLQLIWEYIAQNSAEAADKVQNDFQSAMRRLAWMPGMGHTRSDVTSQHYRFWRVYSYLIIYKPDSKPLQIVRVIHGARDLRNLLRHE